MDLKLRCVIGIDVDIDKKSSHNTLDWVEKQLRDVVAFDMGISNKN